MKFIDEATIIVQSGDGGRGCVSFRRERHIPRGGPNGGDGGNGGNVILKTTSHKRTLYHLQHKKHFRAKNGAPGLGSQKTGGNGANFILELPCGTIVTDAETGQVLYRIPDEVTGLPLADTDTSADWAQVTGDHLSGRRVRYPGWDDFLFWPLTATETASLTVAIAPDAAYDLISQAITQANSSIKISITMR